MTSSLKPILYRTIALLVLVPMAVVSAAIVANHYSDISDSIITENRTLCESVSREVRSSLDEPLSQLILIRTVHSTADTLTGPQIEKVLNEAARNFPYFESIAIVGPAGIAEHIGLGRDLEKLRSDFTGQDFTRHSFYKSSKNRTGAVWSETFISIHTGKPTLTLSMQTGKDIIAGNLNLDYLNSITSRITRRNGLNLAVINRRGQVIAHTNRELVDQHVNLSSLPIIRRALDGTFSNATFSHMGRDVIATTAEIPDTGWVLMVSQDKTKAFTPLFRTQLISLAGTLLTLLLAVTLCRRGVRRIVRPLESLVDKTRLIASGQYASPLPVLSNSFSEISELSTSIGHMARAIDFREQELRNRNDELASIEEELRQQLDETCHTQELLLNEKTLKEAILGSIGDGFFAVDSEDNFTYLNRKAEQAFRVAQSDVIGHKLWDVFKDASLAEFRERYEEIKRTGEYLNFTSCYEPTGTWLEVHCYPFKSGVTVFFRDITKLRQLEEQLSHSQKLESLGTLAGGVAHDFNNILTVIMGCSEMALSSLPKGDGARYYVEQIIEASERASGLTRSMLAFSRKQSIQKRPCDLNAVINTMVTMLRRILREDIELSVSPSIEPLTIEGDPNQLELVIMNLAANARDAMEKGGRFSIELFSAEEIPPTTPETPDPAKIRCALIKVSDTGKGMDQETMDRIFDPFFTTKDIGKGTGLGLSMVYGIITQHRGWITVDSARGSGTVFKIRIPLAEVIQKPEEIRKQNLQHRLISGSESILLVEDDELVRKTTHAILQKSGYQVTTAIHGKDAVHIFETAATPFDLVILDVVMPVMNGHDALRALKAIKPDLKAILCSGYNPDAINESDISFNIYPLLQKPVMPDELLKTVRRILDSPPGTPLET